MSATPGAWNEIRMLRFSILSVFKLCMFFKAGHPRDFQVLLGTGVSFRGRAMSFR